MFREHNNHSVEKELSTVSSPEDVYNHERNETGIAYEPTAEEIVQVPVQNTSFPFLGFVNELEAETANKLQDLRKDVAPLEVLPSPMRDLIQQLADRYKFPPDFSLMYLLYAISISIGNNFRVRVKNKWIESAILYMAIVAKVGNLKTPVQSFFMSPFKGLDESNYESYKANMAMYEKAIQTSKKGQHCQIERPQRKQLLVQDSTPEALIKVMSENRHGVGVMMDELAGFFGNMNRYNRGNEVPMWLSFFNAQPYSYNRKTLLDIYLSHPFVSIIGGIQPKILKKVFSGEMQVNGMPDRFLFVYDPTLIRGKLSREEVDDYLIKTYENVIEHLLRIEPKNDEQTGKVLPKLLDFTEEARELLFEYIDENIDRVNEFNDADNERLAGMYSKYDFHVIRLSFILQVLSDICNGREPQEISVEAVAGGIKLANYYKEHANRVYGLITSDPLAGLDETRKVLYQQLPDDEFSFAEAVALGNDARKTEVEAGSIKPAAIEKWVQRFLQNKNFFIQPKTGFYKKKSGND